MSILVQHISKYYGTQKALDDVSFEIKPGEIVGFLGPNGAGKSTMMKIITGYLPPSEGQVLVNGLDVTEHEQAVKVQLGYLPESNPLYQDMYIEEYLLFVSKLYPAAGPRKERVAKVIEQVGLVPEIHKKIAQLSKGYKQRVGLAQAIIHDPQVLILDEPTSGFDPNQIVDIRNLIVSLGKDKTILLSSHIMQEVEAICDRVLIIKQGKLVADNTADALRSESDKGTEVIQIEFNAAVAGNLLRTISGVKNIQKLSDEQWLVEASSDKDIRPLLFDFAVKHQLQVLSMQKMKQTLEHAFQELTR